MVGRRRGAVFAPCAGGRGLEHVWPQRLSSRIVALFLGLLLAVQLAGFAVVQWSIDRNARLQLAQDLAVGERVWGRRIGNSNAFFFAHGTPNTAPDALESVIGVGFDLLSVDSVAEMRLLWGSTPGTP